MERLFGAAFGGGVGGLVGGVVAFATCEKSSGMFDPSYVCNPGPRLYDSLETALAAHAGFFGLLFLIGGAWLSNRKSKP